VSASLAAGPDLARVALSPWGGNSCQAATQPYISYDRSPLTGKISPANRALPAPGRGGAFRRLAARSARSARRGALDYIDIATDVVTASTKQQGKAARNRQEQRCALRRQGSEVALGSLWPGGGLASGRFYFGRPGAGVSEAWIEASVAHHRRGNRPFNVLRLVRRPRQHKAPIRERRRSRDRARSKCP